MKVVLLYLRIIKKSDPNYVVPKDYDSSAKRFLATYRHYKPTIPHELVVVNCGSKEHDGMFDDVATRYEVDYRGGFDCGSYRHVGGDQDCDLVVGLNTHTYFWRDGWLEPFVKIFQDCGPGVYGPTASYEQNPHLRTPCIAFSPSIVRQYPHPVDTRFDAGQFEFGPDNFSLWADRIGHPVCMVTERGSYCMDNWRTTKNGFRQGNQTDCLVFDRHTEIYSKASASDKARTQRIADGHG